MFVNAHGILGTATGFRQKIQQQRGHPFWLRCFVPFSPPCKSPIESAVVPSRWAKFNAVPSARDVGCYLSGWLSGIRVHVRSEFLNESFIYRKTSLLFLTPWPDAFNEIFAVRRCNVESLAIGPPLYRLILRQTVSRAL